MTNIQKLTEADAREVFALSQFAFQYKLSEEDLQNSIESIKDHTILGWMEEDILAGKVHIIPLECYINGKIFKMGGIASVATWPEYRRQGIVKQLFYQSMLEMKENGQVVSFLHPFSFGFYRKFGWEYTFTNKHYEIPIDHLKQQWEGKGYVRRIQNDISLLQNIYTKYAKQYTGMLVRDEKWWEYNVLDDGFLTVVAFDEDGDAEGYLMFNVKNRIFTVKEMVYTTVNGRKLLFEFIANHDSMAHQVKLVVPENDHLPLLIHEPRFDQQLYPYFMARIVDVHSFLNVYPFQVNNDVTDLSLHITDDFFPDNTGVYKLHMSNGEIDISYQDQTDTSVHIDCSIQQLTSMLLGFKRPIELYNLGMISGDLEQIKQLDQLIPRQQTFLTDFF